MVFRYTNFIFKKINYFLLHIKSIPFLFQTNKTENELPRKWESEGHLPNDDVVFVRVHSGKLDKNNNFLPNAGAFKNTPENGPDLSSDWNKYSTPQKSREQIGLEYKYNTTNFKNPDDFFIASFAVKDIIELNLQQEIIHSPRQDNFPSQVTGSPWNQSHASIIGDHEERRLKMIQLAKWEIAPPSYNQQQDTREFRH